MKHVAQKGDSLPWELDYLSTGYVVILAVSATLLYVIDKARVVLQVLTRSKTTTQFCREQQLSEQLLTS
jgi:hypothetical protein